MEKDAGPVLVADVNDLRLVSAPSMLKMGGVVDGMRLYISRQEITDAVKLYGLILPNCYRFFPGCVRLLVRLCYGQSKFLKKKGWAMPTPSFHAELINTEWYESTQGVDDVVQKLVVCSQSLCAHVARSTTAGADV